MMMIDPAACKAHDDGNKRATWSKWYMLFLFAYTGGVQCLTWFTFGSVPSKLLGSYYGFPADVSKRKAMIDLLMNWGAIGFLLTVPFAMWSLRKGAGLQRAIRVCAFLNFAGTLLRSIPCLFTTATRETPYAWALLHAGQICIAVSGAFWFSAISTLSGLWFPPNQRTTATGISYSAPNVAMCIGYLIGPLIVKCASDMPTFLYTEVGFAAPSLVAALVYCPNSPRTSTELKMSDLSQNDTMKLKYFEGVRSICGNVSMLCLLLAAGISSGSNAAWGGVLPQILQTEPSPALSPFLAGVCGLLNTCGSMAGNILSGVVADRCFQRRLKLLLQIVYILVTISNLWMTFTLPIANLSKPFLDGLSNPIGIACSMFFAGLFQGGLDPLLMELAAELSYPANEGHSAGILGFTYNLSSLVVFFVAPFIANSTMNILYTAIFALTGLLIIPVKENYKRLHNFDNENI